MLLPEELPADCDSLPDLPEEAVFLILTQDCDLVESDLEKEPYVELLLIKPRSAPPDGTFAHGRNPRILDFAIGEITYRASCHERFRIDRKILAGCAPSPAFQVTVALRDCVTDWIAKRYTRAAFPDEFNQRIYREREAIRRILKRDGALFEDILICCTPRREELEPDAAYDFTVWLVMGEEGYRDPPKFNAAQKACVRIEEVLGGCAGLSLEECLVVSTKEVTLSHLKTFDSWDFDYLTHRETMED